MIQIILALVAGITLVLSITSIIDISETLEAKKYAKNQATTQNNNCGSGGIHLKGLSPDGSNAGVSTMNRDSGVTFCQNIDSQIQGDDNSAALAGVQQ